MVTVVSVLNRIRVRGDEVPGGWAAVVRCLQESIIMLMRNLHDSESSTHILLFVMKMLSITRSQSRFTCRILPTAMLPSQAWVTYPWLHMSSTVTRRPVAGDILMVIIQHHPPPTPRSALITQFVNSYPDFDVWEILTNFSARDLPQDTTAWTIGRIFEFLHDAHIEPSIITRDTLPPLVSVLLEALKDASHIATRVCYALGKLAEGFKEHKGG